MANEKAINIEGLGVFKEENDRRYAPNAAIQHNVEQNLTDAQKVIAQNNVFGKDYNAAQHSGLAKVYLQKNNGGLTQDMINQQNTIYVIQYNYDLNGASITIPAGCILDFDGGYISNGTLIGTDTQIRADKKAVFTGITIDGTWNVPYITSAWFSDATSDNKLKQVVNLSDDRTNNYIVIEPGTYAVSAIEGEETVLQLSSNTELVINGVIQLATNSLTAYYIVNTNSKNNITISGSGSIIGDKDTHTGSTGEWGHLINIYESCNVVVKGVTLSGSWGDCIYIGSNKTGICKNIVINSVIINNARRNGISPCSGDNICISNCIISNVSGTNPQAAIDIEPNDGRHCTNVFISNIVVKTCNKGIIVYGQNDYTKNNVVIENCDIDCEHLGIAFFGCLVGRACNNTIKAEYHAIRGNIVDGSQLNTILVSNNVIIINRIPDKDYSGVTTDCAFYLQKGNYYIDHNYVSSPITGFYFASGSKILKDNIITCPTLFFDYKTSGVRIEGNTITGIVNNPGSDSIITNNSISGNVTSNYQRCILSKNRITGDIIFESAGIVEGNKLTNGRVRGSDIIFRNNTVFYDAPTIRGQFITVKSCVGNQINGTSIPTPSADESSIYLIRAQVIDDNEITLDTPIKFVFYPSGITKSIRGNILTLPSTQTSIISSGITGAQIEPVYARIGDTTNKPAFTNDENGIYYQHATYFNTSLNKTVRWNGSVWVDDAGAVVSAPVTYNLTGLTSSSYAQPDLGKEYSVTLSLIDSHHTFPATITIEMGGTTLVVGTDYKYNQPKGSIRIMGAGGSGGITGELVITAASVTN